MNNKKLNLIIYFGLIVTTLWLLLSPKAPCPSKEKIDEYMAKTDFVISGPIERVKYFGQGCSIYKMKYDYASINSRKSSDDCYWGIMDTTEKVIYFWSYTLDTKYIYVKSKDRLISHNIKDTTRIARFRVVDPYIEDLEKYMRPGRIKF